MTVATDRRRLAYIGLGSNLDEPLRQVGKAIDHLAQIPGSELIARSSLYLSGPLGPVVQPDFVNAAVTISTSMTAHELLDELKALERRMGRLPAERWGPRVIDLDLLVFADQTINEPGLQVPHPGIAERNFVLLPLREIAPGLLIPGLGRLADIAVNESKPRIAQIA